MKAELAWVAWVGEVVDKPGLGMTYLAWHLRAGPVDKALCGAPDRVTWILYTGKGKPPGGVLCDRCQDALEPGEF